MKIGIIQEHHPLETRCAITPDIVALYQSLGLTVHIQSKSGLKAGFSDDEFKEAGAHIYKEQDDVLKKVDILLCVNAPNIDTTPSFRKNAMIIGMLATTVSQKDIRFYTESRLTSFAMELVPRISRAQSMDVLSSQSNLAGYRAVIDAVYHYGRAFPMMMTAAGTIKPANVLVLGAGVAGLQAIATAKRLGAVVSAFDVRPDVKEQVQSLGGTFIEVESSRKEENQTAGGYAKEMSDDYKRRQSELIANTLQTQNIAICTALIPGRPAPTLITEEMVKNMPSGSVIVDLAAINGGNCTLTKKDKVVTQHGVTIIGHTNMAGKLAYDASKLYAKNLYHFVKQLVDTKLNRIKINLQDDILQHTLLTHNERIVSTLFKK